MADGSNVKLIIAINEPDTDAEEVDNLTRRLLRDLRTLSEVNEASLIADTKVPEGAKAFGGVLLGMLQTVFGIESIKAVLGVISSRLTSRTVEIEVQANGKSVKIKAGSPAELATVMQTVEKFVAST